LPRMKLKISAKVEAKVKMMKVPPGSEAWIFFSITISEQVYPKTKMGNIFMSYLMEILPRTAARPTTAANPHLAARLMAIRSMVILIGLSNPVMMRSQKEYIRI